MTARAQSLNLVLACAALLVLCLYGVAVGPAGITVIQVVKAIAQHIAPGWTPAHQGIADWQATIIWQVRLPRVVTGACVGAALAVCGAVMQGLFRNPLASPDTLGVTAGGGLGAAIAIFCGLASVQTFALSGFAIAGACVSIVLVYLLAMRGGRASLPTLILAGVALTALNDAIRSFILSLALQQYEVGAAIIFWSLGSLEARTWEHVLLIAPALLIAYVIVRRQTKELDILLLGEVHAISVGVDVVAVRIQLLLTTAVLAGVAVASAGGVSFIGLMAPHIVRSVVGHHHRHLIPMSAVAGAAMLVGSDLLLRTAFSQFDIPVGALTALLGAPFFLTLLLNRRRSVLA